MPSVLGALSREGGSGFHPNIIAGALLYVLPLMIALTAEGLRQRRRQPALWLLAAATVYILGVFVLLQSRGGYIALAVSVLTMFAIHYRWGRWLLVAGVGGAIIGLLLGGATILRLVADNPTIEAVGGLTTLENFRVELWSNTLLVISDFPFTGVGLGAFQEVALLFYPLNVPPDFYFGHAHNFWLQAAIDFGIPGLVAILAIYLVSVVQLHYLWRRSVALATPGLVTGLVGSLVAQSIFGLTDSIPMGSTANLFFWMFFASSLPLATLRFPQPGR